MLHQSESIYARQIANAMDRAVIEESTDQGGFHLMADLVPLYLTAPLLYDIRSAEGITYATLNRELPRSFVNETIIRLLESAATTNNRVFISFPVDTSLYMPGYVKIMDPTISNFG